MDVGTQLRQARESAGLSLEQVAQSTKIQLVKLEALEANDYEQLPQGIYLEGIVRTYAKEVGLDGNLLLAGLDQVREFRPTRHVDGTAVYDLDDFASESETQTMVSSTPPRAAYTPAVAKSREDDAAVVTDPVVASGSAVAAHSAVLSQSPVADSFVRGDSAVLDDESAESTATPYVATRRQGAPSGVAAVLAVLAAVGLGWYLYETSRPFPNVRDVDVPAVSSDAVRTGADRDADAHAAPTEAAPSRERSDESAARQADVSPSQERVEPPSVPQTDPTALRERPEPSTAPKTVGDTSVPTANTRKEAEPRSGIETETTPAKPEIDTPVTKPDLPSNASGDELSGTWSVDTEVQSSSVRAFEGLQLGYRLQLNQQGDRITGHGQKIRENGRELTAPARTPITVHGTLDGDQLVLTFTEQGRRRSSQGTFVLQRDDDGNLRGKFTSDAAQSSGLVAARRPRN